MVGVGCLVASILIPVSGFVSGSAIVRLNMDGDGHLRSTEGSGVQPDLFLQCRQRRVIESSVRLLGRRVPLRVSLVTLVAVDPHPLRVDPNALEGMEPDIIAALNDWASAHPEHGFEPFESLGRARYPRAFVPGVLVVSLVSIGALLCVAGASLCGLGGLNAFAIRRRRAFGACRECGYDLDGIEGTRCPECGAQVGGRAYPNR